MHRTIMVYSDERLSEIRTNFANRPFVGFGFIFNEASSVEDIKSLDDDFDNYVVDITSLAFDTGYYRMFIERYLYALMNKFNNMVFVIINHHIASLLDRFPNLFNNVDENYSTRLKQKVKSDEFFMYNENKYIKYISLSLYKKPLLDSDIENYKIVSIGSFFNGADNLNYKFNIETIASALETEEIKYIDITSVIELFKLRSDLILTFDILLRQIYVIKAGIKFLICDEKFENVKSYLPFTFRVDTMFPTEEIRNDETNHNKFRSVQIKTIIDTLNERLKGHDKFKKDFELNLRKYIFLNDLGERKLFSIFLTGESGIGKTEFAKMLSEIMYSGQELIKINFGNYSNEGVLNSLIGSPLGYIGSEEGGELINKMKLSKSKIILIDEFEKATSSVFHFFYELLEDGKFTDRHGIEHNLDGYIIIFTSNMPRKRYIENIPNPLKSRFDLVYCFVELPADEKRKFVIETTMKLIDKIYENTNVQIEARCVDSEMDNLIKNNNLRSIKRKIEDIVIAQYYKIVG